MSCSAAGRRLVYDFYKLTDVEIGIVGAGTERTMRRRRSPCLAKR
jgi:hypothetical protein